MGHHFKGCRLDWVCEFFKANRRNYLTPRCLPDQFVLNTPYLFDLLVVRAAALAVQVLGGQFGQRRAYESARGV